METTSSSVQLVTIDPDQDGQRIDNFLIARLKGVPRSRIYRILRKGEVRVNKGRIKAEYKVCAGDIVRIPPIRMAQSDTKPKPSEKLLLTIANSIIFENDDLVVVNKASGIAVHGGSGISLGLIELLRFHFQNQRLELVHRIDRETSGCVLIAKRRKVLTELQNQFREKTIEKHYLALVSGKWPNTTRQIDAPLLKNQLESGERIVKISGEGKASLTEFRVLKRFKKATLVDAKPITGRTHQIRVHCRFAKHPIIADEKYANEESDKNTKLLAIKRLFLHAATLEFTLPGGSERLKIEAPLPADLQNALDRIELNENASKLHNGLT
ncbi:23S rRNA pseudouridine(955/2504/2580) synthase RluC [Aurantivibrio infirmus]